jgi:hypothetical protein
MGLRSNSLPAVVPILFICFITGCSSSGVAESKGAGSSDIPILGDAVNINRMSCGEFAFGSDLNSEQVIDFYKSEMSGNGWIFLKQEVDDTASNATPTFLYFEKSGQRAVIEEIDFRGNGGGPNSLVLINPNAWYIAQCQEDDVPQDIPLIGDFRGGFASTDETHTLNNGPEQPHHTVDYHTTQSLETVIAFYRSSMIQDGWELVNDRCDSDCRLFFKKTGRTVVFQFLDNTRGEVLMENAAIHITADSWDGTYVYIDTY